MSTTITRTDKRKDTQIAFDAACDAAYEGRPDEAERILDRAFPQPQARHIFENILAHYHTPLPI